MPFWEAVLRTGFVVFASAVGLALAAIVHADRGPAATHHPATGHVRVAGLSPAAAPSVSSPPPRPGIVISERDRDAVYDYYGIKHAPGACPAGLVKVPNGCLPGQPRGTWTIGKPLQDDELSYPLPAVLLGQISPPPYGYEYARIDGDVLIIDRDSRIVAAALAAPDAN
jgi:hypothetical protein